MQENRLKKGKEIFSHPNFCIHLIWREKMKWEAKRSWEKFHFLAQTQLKKSENFARVRSMRFKNNLVYVTHNHIHRRRGDIKHLITIFSLIFFFAFIHFSQTMISFMSIYTFSSYYACLYYRIDWSLGNENIKVHWQNVKKILNSK